MSDIRARARARRFLLSRVTRTPPPALAVVYIPRDSRAQRATSCYFIARDSVDTRPAISRSSRRKTGIGSAPSEPIERLSWRARGGNKDQARTISPRVFRTVTRASSIRSEAKLSRRLASFRADRRRIPSTERERFFSLASSPRNTIAITILENCRVLSSPPAGNSIAALTCYTHAADVSRHIRARTDTQGSTLMARATGGSSKVTYPRKPRVSLSLSLSLSRFCSPLLPSPAAQLVFIYARSSPHDQAPTRDNDQGRTGIT